MLGGGKFIFKLSINGPVIISLCQHRDDRETLPQVKRHELSHRISLKLYAPLRTLLERYRLKTKHHLFPIQSNLWLPTIVYHVRKALRGLKRFPGKKATQHLEVLERRETLLM